MAAAQGAVPLRRAARAGDVLPGRYLVSVDGVEQEYAAANVVVANSAYYGSGMKIAPAAAVADGLLDVVVIEAASKLALMRSLPKVYDGAHVALPEVTVLDRPAGRAPRRRHPPGPGRRRRRAARPAARAADEPAVVEVQPGALAVIA